MMAGCVRAIVAIWLDKLDEMAGTVARMAVAE